MRPARRSAPAHREGGASLRAGPRGSPRGWPGSRKGREGRGQGRSGSRHFWKARPDAGAGDQDPVVGFGVAASSGGAAPFKRSFNSFPILKYGIFLGGTSTFSPVLGLRPLRGARFRKRKLPKPRISTSCPLWRAETTLFRAASTMMPD